MIAAMHKDASKRAGLRIVAAAAAIAGHAPFVHARLAWQLGWCYGKRDPTPDMRIGSCTIIIQTGNQEGFTLANTFVNRGDAHRDKGEDDRAIADYTEAIQTDPESSVAFHSRGDAYLRRKDYD